MEKELCLNARAERVAVALMENLVDALGVVGVVPRVGEKDLFGEKFTQARIDHVMGPLKESARLIAEQFSELVF